MSLETRKLSDIEFPIYFSLVPDPGYNRSILDEYGITGEWNLFSGDWDYNGGAKYGGNGKIEGIFNSLVSENL